MFTLVADGYIVAAGAKKDALVLEEDDIAEILMDKYFLKEKEAKELAKKAEITEETVKEIIKTEKEQAHKAKIRAKTEKEKKVVFYKDKDTKDFKIEMHKVPTSPYCAALKEAGHKSIYVFTWEEAFETPFTELPARLQRDYIGVIKRLRPLKDKVVDANESIENKIKENEEMSVNE